MGMVVYIYCVMLIVAMVFSENSKAMVRSFTFKLLALLLLYTTLIDLLIVSNVIAEFSFLHFSTGLSSSLFVPLSYQFIQNYYTEKPNTHKDLPHLIPFLVLFSAYIGYTLLRNPSSTALYLPCRVYLYTMTALYSLMLLKLLPFPFYRTIEMKTVNNPPQEVEFNSRLNNWLNDLAQPSSLFYRHPHNNFTSAQVEKMKERIEREMEVNQPYLQPGFSISQLAKQTDIHPNQLSAFINQQYQMRYTDFVNQYRIQYFKKKLMEEESWKYLTLQAIAKAAGFGNRNTFTKAFKKHDGTTPTEFLKKVKLNKTEAA